jgi:hypothetical protein
MWASYPVGSFFGRPESRPASSTSRPDSSGLLRPLTGPLSRAFPRESISAMRRSTVHLYARMYSYPTEMKMIAMKERAKTKREDMCHCLKMIQVSTIWVFLRLARGGEFKKMHGQEILVRTRACASNKLDPCPCHRGLRARCGRDP